MKGKIAFFMLVTLALFGLPAALGAAEGAETGKRGPEAMETRAKSLSQKGLPYIVLSGNLLKAAPKTVSVEDLENLPQTEFAVVDPYLKKRVVYKGVLLKDLVAAYAKPDTTKIRLRAIDEYRAEFIREEWVRFDIMLATRMNGKHMGIRENGPARIVLPYDTAKDIDKTLYKPKWIWQVNRIEFLEE